MPRCDTCGAEVPEQAAFCPACGTELPPAADPGLPAGSPGTEDGLGAVEAAPPEPPVEESGPTVRPESSEIGKLGNQETGR
jgi:hypothetical protein